MNGPSDQLDKLEIGSKRSRQQARLDTPLILNHTMEAPEQGQAIKLDLQKKIKVNLPTEKLNWKSASRKKFQEGSSSDNEKKKNLGKLLDDYKAD